MKRKIVVLNSMVFVLSLLAVSFVLQSRLDANASTTSLVSSLDVLRFPVNNFTEQTLSVTTSAGQKNVTYRLYRHIAYVANPVDENYESLDVGVPVNINDQNIDATNAPILLVVNAPGYLSSSNFAGGLGRLPSDTNGKYALVAGCVVVVPGLRGRDQPFVNGTYYGKAPAGIVDLKAAVRYIRHNRGVMPGNSDWIIASGISGGGALSSLLGVSGDSHLYDAALAEIGAANASDSVFASAPYCPITDLDHADMAYEWEFGTTPLSGSLVNQSISQLLKNNFSVYQASLKLQGNNAFGNVTADNYGDYLVKTYLIPSANKYLSALTNDSRTSYLASRTWITWSNNSASFTWPDYIAYIGRSKKLPAFDAFDLSGWENSLFGNSTTSARHFTNFSLQQATGNPNAMLDADLPVTINMMNPMYFLSQNSSACAQYWFIRSGTKDTDTAHTIFGNLAMSLENRGKSVNATLYWDGGHGVNQDPDAFVAWVGQITNYSIVITAGGLSRTYGGTGDDRGWGDIVQTSDGGYVISGDTASFGAGVSDYWLIKLDSAGNMLWNKTYGGSLTESENAMIQTSDGGFAMAGVTNSFGAGGNDFWLVKTDANGNAQWNKTYGGTGSDTCVTVFQTSDGGYAIAGLTSSFGAGSMDAWLVKTDATGNMQWNKTYGGTGADYAFSVVQTSDGGYTVSGPTASFGAGNTDIWLFKTDSAGNMLWNKTYGGSAAEWMDQMILTADGGYAISGYTASFGAGAQDVWLVKTDSAGNMQWNKTYGGTGNDNGFHLLQTADGYVIIGSTVSFGAGGTDFWLIKTDANGNLMWDQTYGGTGGDWGYSVIQTSDGGYALAGYTNSFGAGSQDFYMVKTDGVGVVPEFSSWLIPLLALASTGLLLIGKKRRLRMH